MFNIPNIKLTPKLNNTMINPDLNQVSDIKIVKTNIKIIKIEY